VQTSALSAEQITHFRMPVRFALTKEENRLFFVGHVVPPRCVEYFSLRTDHTRLIPELY
jgi:hypothetical protein